MNCTLCRLCGCRKRNLRPIFDVSEATNKPGHVKSDAFNVADLIHKWMGLQVKENEDLPQSVCIMCLNTLTSWHTFYERSKTIQHRFADPRIIQKHECISTTTTNDDVSKSLKTDEIPCANSCNDKKPEKLISSVRQIQDCPTRLSNNIIDDTSILPLVKRKVCKPSHMKNKHIPKVATKKGISNDKSGQDHQICQQSQIVSNQQKQRDSSIKNTDTVDFIPETTSNSTKTSLDGFITPVQQTVPNRKSVKARQSRPTKIIKTKLNALKKKHLIKLPAQKTNASPLCLQCRFCEKIYPSKRAYNRHMLMHTDLKEFRCATCLKVYRSKQSLQAHLETHSETRNYICHICGQSYQTASTLCNHIQRQHREDPVAMRAFTCSTCGKQFRLSHHLEQHMRMHTGIKPFSCTECPRQFGCAAYLRRHIEALHLNTKRHVCATCGKQYLHTTHFKAHLLRHSGLRAFKCSVCDKAFTTRNELMKHERVHSRHKPFQCPHCDKAFSDWSNRKRHVATHERPSPKQRKTAFKSNSANSKTYASLQTFYQSSESFAGTMEEGFVNVDYVNLTLLSTQEDSSRNADNGQEKVITSSDGDVNGEKCVENEEIPLMKGVFRSRLDSETGKENGFLIFSTKRLDPTFGTGNEIVLSGHGFPKVPGETSKVLSPEKRDIHRKGVFTQNVVNINGIEVFLENGNIKSAGMNESFLITVENSLGNSEENGIPGSKESICVLNGQGTAVLATSSEH